MPEDSLKRYDSIVIGAGQGGKPLALSLANAGQQVALIEREHIGGTCVNVGCTPTKTMVASARVAYLSSRGREYGVHTGSVNMDMHRIRERKRTVVKSFREASERQIANTEGLTLIRGAATFDGPASLRVTLNDGGGSQRLKADRIVIDTGGRVAVPEIDGLQNIPYLDSTSIMEIDQLPEHLIVLGGGYVGLEFGQMFRRFGSRVTVVHRGMRVLSREDEDVADGIAKILRDDGIALIPGVRPVRVHAGGGIISLVIATPSGERTVQGSHLLIATGRTPNTEDLHLEAASIETDSHGFIKVSDSLETTCKTVYAIGDVKGGPAFTHISYDDFRVLQRRFLHGEDATIRNRYVPYTVFIDPQLGRVGLTESEARNRGLEFRIATMPMSYVARAIEVDETRGFVKVLIDGKSDRILGCSVLGLEGGEIMAMLQIAMMGNMGYAQLRDATFAHPTLAESLNTLFAAV